MNFTTPGIQIQEEWLKVLDKGMVTIPKKWRDDLGITKGNVLKAKKQGNNVILETSTAKVPYRIYTDKEIDEFLRLDQLETTQMKKNTKKRKTRAHG